MERDYFFCEICRVKATSLHEFNKHLSDQGHKKNMEVRQFFCDRCSIRTGSQKDLDDHINKHNQKEIKELVGQKSCDDRPIGTPEPASATKPNRHEETPFIKGTPDRVTSLALEILGLDIGEPDDTIDQSGSIIGVKDEHISGPPPLGLIPSHESRQTVPIESAIQDSEPKIQRDGASILPSTPSRDAFTPALPTVTRPTGAIPRTPQVQDVGRGSHADIGVKTASQESNLGAGDGDDPIKGKYIVTPLFIRDFRCDSIE